MVASMGVMTFLQFKKVKEKKMPQYPHPNQPQQPQGMQQSPAGQINIAQNNPYVPQIPQQAQLSQSLQPQQPPENFREQNLSTIANKNYKEVYRNLSKEMAQQKQQQVGQAKQDFLETMKAERLGDDPSHFSSTVDIINPQGMDIYHIGTDGRPTEKAEVNAKLDQQAYWQNQKNRLLMAGGAASLFLLMIMVI